MTLIINYIKLFYLINTNYIYRLLKRGKKIIGIIYLLKQTIEYLFNKVIYLCSIYYSYQFIKEYISINKYIIILTLVGGLFNTLLFNKDKVISIIVNKYNKINILSIYYLKVILNYFIFLIVFQIKENNLYYLVNLTIFFLLNKNIFNYIYLKYFLRTNNFYKEDEISLRKVMLIIIIVILVNIIDSKILMLIINIFAVLSTVKIHRLKHIERLYLNISFCDHYIKENIGITKLEVKDKKESYNYLNHIFRKRYLKYYFIYGLRFLLIIIIYFILDKDIFDSFFNAIKELIVILALFNSTNKMIDLYYYKSDYYFDNRRVLRYKRIKELIIISLPSIILINILLFIKLKNVMILMFPIIIMSFIVFMKYLCYEKNSLYKDKHKNIKYYVIECLNIIIILLIDIV